MENSILSLPPGEFLFALDELGLPDDQREFLLSQYGASEPPEPRPPVPEGRSFGYHLLDNLIGFDDDYETRGEALKSGISDTLSAVAADPLGAAWAVAKSVPEQAYDLIDQIDRGMRGEATPLEILEIATIPALGFLTAASRTGRGIARLADNTTPDTRAVDELSDLRPRDIDDPWDLFDETDEMWGTVDHWEGVQPLADPDELWGTVDPWEDVQPFPAPEDPWGGMQPLSAPDDIDVPPTGRTPVTDRVLETPEFDLETALFSPLTRAVQGLEQPSYGSVDEVRQNLIRLGARGPELQLAEDQGFFEDLRETEDLLGEIPTSRIEEHLSELSPLLRTEQGGTRSVLSTSFDGYFLPGGENYRETIFALPQTPAGRDKPFFAAAHWPNLENPAFHIRSATFPAGDGGSLGGRAFHVGEIQSDMGAEYRQQRGLADLYTRPLDRSPLQWQLDLQGRTRAMAEELDQLRTAIRTKDPSLVGETSLIRVGDRLESLQRRFEAIPLELMDPAASPDTLSPEAIRGFRKGVDLASAPMVRNSTSINQAAVARSLDDAVREGSDWLTFSTGDMTYGYTRGTREGQRTAYDTILPRDINGYLRRLNEHIREQVPDFPGLTLEETSIHTRDGAYRVPGIRLTPEDRQVLRESGILAFREGGIVGLLP
jgi:hypothetical protein